MHTLFIQSTSLLQYLQKCHIELHIIIGTMVSPIAKRSPQFALNANK